MRYLLLPLLALGATAAPVYRYCDPAVEDCTVVHTVRHPTAQEQMGLSSELFAMWFQTSGGFGWSIRDSSADGVIIGHVLSTDTFHDSQFVFKAGVLYCCWFDDPFILNDINDAGYIVGGYPVGVQGPLVFCTPGHLSCEPRLPNPYQITMAPGLYPPDTLLVIDDRNWIVSASPRSADGLADLRTLIPTGIPEPSTYITLGTALLILGVYRLSRQNRVGDRTNYFYPIADAHGSVPTHDA